MKNQTSTLTTKELETVKILVRLGDSKDLAIKTVINERENEAKKASAINFYSNAYGK